MVRLRDPPAFDLSGPELTIPAGETTSDVQTSSARTVTLTAEDNAVDEGDRRGDSDRHAVRQQPGDRGESGHANHHRRRHPRGDGDAGHAEHTRGGERDYTVKLNSEPTGPVTVEITSNNDKVEVDSSELTFQPNNNNWSREQSVTVTVKEDSDAVDEQVVLTHTATGGDYSESATVTVNVDDKDKSVRHGASGGRSEDGQGRIESVGDRDGHAEWSDAHGTYGGAGIGRPR